MGFSTRHLTLLVAVVFTITPLASALERPEVFKVFQFPANKIPRIDGDASDWEMVPSEYIVGTDQLLDDQGRGRKPDPKSLDVKVRVGWVKGLNRLYFLYQAHDDYWDFSRTDLHNDTFEIIVDGDRSGGPLINRFHPDAEPAARVNPRAGADPAPPAATQPAAPGQYLSATDAWYNFQGNHAQNYHIFVPAEEKDWCMAFGPQAEWIKKLPYSNVAYSYTVKPGEAGDVTCEFWITPFDYAGAEGPSRAVESILSENKIIGLSWAIIDYDNAEQNTSRFWNLSPKHTMFGQASELCKFQLMPVEEKLRKPIDADWSFKILDRQRRAVAFQDESTGNITSWKWDFGDGTTSDERYPTHTYEKTGQYVVVLYVEGPAGKARRARVWDVTLK
jgi:hypothetical protein